MLGRPPEYSNPEDLQQAIDKFFSTLSPDEPPTITGLCYSLGFESRQSFYDYEEKPDFTYTIKRARLRIENKYESKLFSNNNAGAIFALKNFGWSDKQEINQKTEVSGSLDITGMEIM